MALAGRWSKLFYCALAKTELVSIFSPKPIFFTKTNFFHQNQFFQLSELYNILKFQGFFFKWKILNETSHYGALNYLIQLNFWTLAITYQ